MAAGVVCVPLSGKKRLYIFEDDDEELQLSYPVSKRHRSSRSRLLDQLKSSFPNTDPKFLEQALEEYGENLDSTIINRLQNISFESAKENPVPNPSDLNKIEWVDVFVKEMISATSVEDAKSRALKALEIVEKSASGRALQEATRGLEDENMTLKERVETLKKENGVLKRGVAIQYQKVKELEGKVGELKQLKEMITEYKEKLSRLEVEKYGLAMHLNQALQSNVSVHGRYVA